MELQCDWSFIDKVVYINLNKRTDRKESMLSEFKRVGMPDDKIIRLEAFEHEKGYIGCLQSHLAALNMAKENKWQNILIVEDDMVFNNDNTLPQRLAGFMRKLQETSWDVALLSTAYHTIKQIEDEFFKAIFAYQSNCYLVNAHYYDTIISDFSTSLEQLKMGGERKCFVLDQSWIKLMRKDNWYGIYPCIGYQKAGLSDIWGYGVNLENKFFKDVKQLKANGSVFNDTAEK
ncbi:glycosyltransferase family 25 protein [Enterobacteriaceae bacterium LUAb1]